VRAEASVRVPLQQDKKRNGYSPSER
jgi:hypothetical protein